MKNTFTLIVVLVLLLGGYFVFNSVFPKIKIKENNASIVYIYEDKTINSNLTVDESEFLKKIFNGKRAYFDNPSCGFDENVSVRFSDMTFCIACDTCSIIKVKDRYFGISDEEREEINKIFEKYGGKFPCV